MQVTGASGFFTVTVGSLPSSTYQWRVKGPGFLANSGSVALARAPTTPVEIGLMRAGDVNNDNTVEITDFSLLKGNFGQGGASPLQTEGP